MGDDERDLDVVDAYFAGLKLSGGGGLTATPVEDNSDNKRLHIKFHDPDLFLLPIQIRAYRMKDVFQEKILASVWNSFGTVTDTFYHERYEYCFLSFQTHDMASEALRNLNIGDRVREAIDRVINAQPEAKAKKLVKDLTAMLFKKKRDSLVRASWARPRMETRRDYDYDDYHTEHYDDCPDDIDRDEWNAYCEGRD
jgi:hypothetical protein